MCGIAGLILKRNCEHRLPVPTVLEQMRHRGPDGHGYLVYANGTARLGRDWESPKEKPEVLFLHRRLAILDLSEAGWQPMGTKDGRYFVTFNGEIYNFLELRQELEHLGY